MAVEPDPAVAETVAHYDRHAGAFAAETADLDLAPLHDRFLRRLPAGPTAAATPPLYPPYASHHVTRLLVAADQRSTFVPAMDPAFAYTVADLARDESVKLKCDCRVRTYSRTELAAMVGLDARLHLVGLHRTLWCGDCG